MPSRRAEIADLGPRWQTARALAPGRGTYMSPRALVFLLLFSVGVIVMLPAAAGAGSVPAVAAGNDMPSWAPDGSKIAFVSFRNGRVGDLFTIRPDGRGEQRLTTTPFHEDMPRWSRDGSKIAYVRQTAVGGREFQVFVMNADGSDQRQLTRIGAANFAPTWSHDGTKIAFVTTRHGDNNPEIYVINVDGTGETRLTNHPARDDSPSWSPDGSLIAFDSNRSPILTPRLYVMRPDGTGVRPLTNHPIDYHNEMQPAWSPDGRTVAFITERNPPFNNTEVYLVDADGNNSRRVTRNLVRDANPTFSPDGQRLAVARGAALRPEIYLMRRQGGGDRKLTGVNLTFVRLWRSATQPRAGRFFAVELTVRPALDRFAEVACYAAVGRRLIEPEAATVRNGRVHCAWFVPRSAKNKTLFGFVGARAGRTQVTRRFTLRIR
jgi:Tol biopolymer transport system component